MLSSEIINTYYRRMIREKMKNSNEGQPSLIQQDLQFLNTHTDNSTQSKTLKILKSRVFTRSTVSGYSSDLLKNTHQYRIINSGMGDVLGMTQTTQISYNSSPEYSSPLLFRTALEKQYSSKQIISTSVSTGTQTLPSESFEAGTQTLSNYAEAASQTDTEMTPAEATGVSPSTIMASIQTSSSADIKTRVLADENDATRSTVQCIADQYPTDKRQQSKFSEKKIISSFEEFKEILNDMNESLKTSMELLKQEVDRFENSESVAYIRISTALPDTMNSEYRSVNSYNESSFRSVKSDQFFEDPSNLSDISSRDIFHSASSLYTCNTQDTEDFYPVKEYFYDPSTTNTYDKSETPEYFYSYVDSSKDISTTSSDDEDRSEYASFRSVNEFASLSEQYYSVQQDSLSSDPDTRSSEQFFSAMDTNEPSLSRHDSNLQEHSISSSEYDDMDISEDEIISTKYDTAPNGHGTTERIGSCGHAMDISEHEIILSEQVIGHVQDTDSRKYDTATNEHDTSEQLDIPEHISSCEHNMDISEHEIILSEQAIVHVQDTNITPNEHGTSEQRDVPEQEFDIRNMVTRNSFGNKVLDYSTMLSMYGFDPRKSPFVHCGYLRMDNLPEDLDDLELQDIERSDVKYQINENGSYKEIGRGSYGVVYLAIMKNIQNNVVVKKFHNQGVRWEDVELEAKILTYLQGQDITPNFLGVLAPRKKSRSYSLVQEYYGHGTVEDIYLNCKLPPYAWIIICRNICRVLFKIHNNHVLFNDVKSDNILINLENLDIRFIDFGIATFRQGLMCGNSKSLQECLFYAPEVREGCFSSPQSDIYSLGFLFKQIIKYGNIVELYPLYKACTSVKAVDRPSLPKIMEILDKL